jgi:hypothetical protein
VTAEESQFFMKFVDECDNGKYSSMVGWVITQGKILDSRVLELKDAINSVAGLSGVNPRNSTGWAVCLYFLEKVKKTTCK